MGSIYLVPPPPKRTIPLNELLNWLATRKAVTAIGLEKRFHVGFITSKEIIEGLVGLGILTRGTFFFPVKHSALTTNQKCLNPGPKEAIRPIA